MPLELDGVHMNRTLGSALRTRAVVAALLVVAAFVAVSLLWPKPSEERTAQGAEAEAFLLTTDPGVTRLAPDLQGAKQVADLQQLKDALSGPAVILVDRSVTPGLGTGSLRDFAAKGYALIGLNVPLDELSALAGFTEEISGINPQFGKHDPAPATFKGDFFTVVWRTPADAKTQRWSRGQQDLSPALFAAVLADQKLRSAGLARDAQGNLIPLEDY